MPTYGYRCQDCEREFDVWQRMTDDPKAACPTCGGSGKRLFFPAGLVFKGSGFYVTDNRRGAGANGSKSASTSESKPDKSTSDKSTSGKSKPDSGSSSSSSTAGTSAGTASGSTSE